MDGGPLRCEELCTCVDGRRLVAMSCVCAAGGARTAGSEDGLWMAGSVVGRHRRHGVDGWEGVRL